MKKIFTLLFIIYSSIVDAQLFTYKFVNHKNGLGLSSVLSVSQDKNGFMLLGTDGFGIQKFDGKIVKPYDLGNAGNEHHVTYVDQINQEIYFSSKYQGFFNIRNKKITQLLKNQRDFGEYFCIKKIGKSMLYVGSKKMKLIKDNKIIQEFSFSKNIKNIVQIQKIGSNYIFIIENNNFYISENKIEKLEKWLKQKIQPVAIRYYENKIEIFEQAKTEKLIVYLSKNGEIFSKENKKTRTVITEAFIKVYSKDRIIFGLNEKEQIFQFKNNDFRYIPINSTKKNIHFTNLFIDNNYDLWAGTSNIGVVKISQEPFTKIELNEIYQNPLINFIYKTELNDIFISTFEDISYVGSYKSSEFISYNFKIYNQSTFNKLKIFGTSNGIQYFQNGQFRHLNSILPKEKIIFTYGIDQQLFFCAESKGLMVFNSENKKIKKIILSNTVSHIYTAQLSFDQKYLFLGTNDGVFKLDILNGTAINIGPKFKIEGSYAGVSCVDSHGTIWFSYDKSIIGITKRDEYVVIQGSKHFKSTLFYSLDSDPYGNLIVATNLGVSKLKVDHIGNVLNYFEYNSSNGFGGFETHMRSSFKEGKIIYIGTIEGVFSINTEKLEFLPHPPVPFVFENKERPEKEIYSDEDLVKINFMVINPKLSGIQYSYRLKGKSPNWSPLTTKTEAYFSNLSDKEYVFQVKSTYDGYSFSKISNYKITKNTPFWKTNWFILFLVLSIALGNIIVLDRSKSFELSQIIDNQDIEINSKIRTIILLFGLIANNGTHFLASYIDKNLAHYDVLNLCISCAFVILIILSFSKNAAQRMKKQLLQIALYLVVGQCYIAAFLSSVHPIYVVIIALSTSLTPFILNKISQVVIFSIFQIISIITIMFLVENAIYNEILFLIAIIVSICLSIFTTYIRNESLQKLIFISGIINKGNVIALAYNQNNDITYISENSYSKLNINPNVYLGKKIGELNKFILQHLSKHKIDLNTEFKNDKQHLIPMKKADNSVIWMEWSCTVFSNKIKVVFGQDVSERVSIEHNYEALVENAQDLIFYVDVFGNFLFTNHKFQQILGYEEQELIGRDSIFVVSENYQKQVRDFYTEQFQKKQLHTYHELLITKKDGSEIWIGQNTTILYATGSDKIVKGFLCISRDITNKRKQQILIQNQNENIHASINYALKIQQNLLPNISLLKALFNKIEVVYKPKEIVSGDFYYCEKIDSTIIFVLADCTGHGVPGAFMTLLGINLLNQIISEEKVTDPALILSRIDDKLINILPRESNSSLRDGIEMTVFVFDQFKQTYTYGCAGGKFIVKTNDKFEIMRGESKHIGDLAESNFIRYNTYTIEHKEIDALYFFTDGLQDQFSESTSKKFTIKRLIEVLEKYKHLPIENLVHEVNAKNETWRGKAEQTDDITFIGIEL